MLVVDPLVRQRGGPLAALESWVGNTTAFAGLRQRGTTRGMGEVPPDQLDVRALLERRPRIPHG